MVHEVDKGWWTPGEIVFARRQMEWLISWLPTLEAGQWPPIPQGDSFSKHTGMPRAPFEAPAQIYAEVTDRLEMCGVDGELLQDWYLWQKPMRSLEVVYHGNVDDIWTWVDRAMRYVKGFSRKPCTYAEWIAAGWKVPYELRRKNKNVTHNGS